MMDINEVIFDALLNSVFPHLETRGIVTKEDRTFVFKKSEPREVRLIFSKSRRDGTIVVI